MVYHINKDDVPEAGLGSKGGELKTRMVYGEDTSMMYAERPEDYHSKPHAHDSEQFNYVIEGKIWIFIEDEAMLLEPGDFNRIPELDIHWSKVEEGPCIMVESHTPPYIGDPDLAGEEFEKVVGLFEDEDEHPDSISVNIWGSESYAENEEEMMEEHLENKD
jgi:quercetin dioxygenase-like cupin family protein